MSKPAETKQVQLSSLPVELEVTVTHKTGSGTKMPATSQGTVLLHQLLKQGKNQEKVDAITGKARATMPVRAHEHKLISTGLQNWGSTDKQQHGVD